MKTPRIIPHLWYDREAQEAAGFYASTFPESRVTDVAILPGTPSSEVEIVSFEILGQRFEAISAGPHFRFTPAISFIVVRDTAAEVDALWAKLADGGTPLMPLDAYPFSPRYGWIQDRYGLSWQLIMPADPEAPWRPPVVPSLLFTGANAGRAEEALEFYVSVFPGAERGEVARYPAGMEPDREGTLMYGDFTAFGQWFAVMDSARGEHRFNEAISLMVECDTQAEIDRYWKALSAVPEAEQCGWLKDRFGVSWQVIPTALGRMIRGGSPDQVARVTEAFLKMKKFDIAALERAYAG